jgi:hypothetical protein
METKRKIGKTTAQILDALAKAINSPATPIRFIDHAQPKDLPTSYTSSYVAKITRKIVDKLGLKDIEIDYCNRGVRIVSHLGSPYTRVQGA